MKKGIHWKWLLFVLLAYGISFTKQVNAQENITYGNEPEIIFNGGDIVSTEEGDIYYLSSVDGMIYHDVNNSPVLFSTDTGKYLNIINHELYYVISDGGSDFIRKRNLDTKISEDVYHSSEMITQLLVSSDGNLFFLENGIIYNYNMHTEELNSYQRNEKISSYIPTGSGYIYAVGKARNLTLYYNEKQIADQVGNYYVSQEHLIFVQGDYTYQIALENLDKENEVKIELYDEDQYCLSDIDINEEDVLCDYEETSDEVQTEKAAVYARTLAGTSGFSSATTRQQNIVKRARQQLEIKWTPLQDITGWDSAYVFQKGITYTGLPYGQPIDGLFVPWGTSLSGFIKAVDNINSKMYTSYSDYATDHAPYYSSDCSSFVSWAWNLTGRRTTRSLPTYSDQVATQSVYNVEIGDSLVAYGIHATMVLDVGYYTDGTIAYVDIAEQTPPKTKVTRYGSGSTYSLADLQKKYLQGGYILYRLKSQYSVVYTHDCAVPIDDSCSKCSTLTAPVITEIEQTAVDSVYLSWSNVPKAGAYVVTRAESESGTYQWIKSVYGNSYVDSGLNPNQKYYYKIRALQYIGNTWKAGPESAAVEAPFLKIPQNVTASVAAAQTQIVEVKWEAVNGATAYGILRSETVGGNYEWIGAVTGTSYKDSKVTNGKVYYYKVYAARSGANGSFNGECSDTAAVVIPHEAIKNVQTGPGAGVHAVKITWDIVDGATVYGVLRAESENGAYTWVAAVSGGNYTDNNLTPGKTYYYKVYASIQWKGKWYNGACSAAAPGSMIDAAQNVKVESYQGNGLRVTWDAVPGASGYSVYCADRRGGSLRGLAVVTTNSFVHKGLEPGITKYYVIQTQCMVDGQQGIGNHTEYVGGTVLLGIPEIMEVSPGAGTHAIKISWKKTDGATMYGILRAESENGPYSWIAASGNTTYTDENLDQNKTYYYKVYASRYKDNTWMSGKESGAVSGQVCGAPVGLSAASVAEGIQLKWNRVDRAVAYYVYRNEGTGLSFIGMASSTEYLDQVNLRLGKEYSYVVQSVVYMDGAYGLGANTEPVSVVYGMGVPKQIYASVDESSHVVEVTWTSVAAAQFYGVLRMEAESGQYQWISATGQTRYQDETCEAGKTYYYKVYASALVDGIWYNGTSSDAATITIPGKKTALGVDVSYHNGNIDWNQVRQSGVTYAMVRIGYRRNADGVIIEDSCAKRNLEGALAAGIQVGAYFFSTALNENEAQEEAQWVNQYIKNYNVTFPVAYDCEGYDKTSSRMYGISKEQRTSNAVTFLDIIAGQGYTPLMYGSKSHLVSSWNISLLESRYKIWVAQWPSAQLVYPNVGRTTYDRPYLMWQYTEKGSISGITGSVDLNVYYYEE